MGFFISYILGIWRDHIITTTGDLFCVFDIVAIFYCWCHRIFLLDEVLLLHYIVVFWYISVCNNTISVTQDTYGGNLIDYSICRFAA